MRNFRMGSEVAERTCGAMFVESGWRTRICCGALSVRRFAGMVSPARQNRPVHRMSARCGARSVLAMFGAAIMRGCIQPPGSCADDTGSLSHAWRQRIGRRYRQQSGAKDSPPTFIGLDSRTGACPAMACTTATADEVASAQVLSISVSDPAAYRARPGRALQAMSGSSVRMAGSPVDVVDRDRVLIARVGSACGDAAMVAVCCGQSTLPVSPVEIQSRQSETVLSIRARRFKVRSRASADCSQTFTRSRSCGQAAMGPALRGVFGDQTRRSRVEASGRAARR